MQQRDERRSPGVRRGPLNQHLRKLRAHALLVLGSRGRPAVNGEDTEHLPLLGAQDTLGNQPDVQRGPQVLPERFHHGLRLPPLMGTDDPSAPSRIGSTVLDGSKTTTCFPSSRLTRSNRVSSRRFAPPRAMSTCSAGSSSFPVASSVSSRRRSSASNMAPRLGPSGSAAQRSVAAPPGAGGTC